MSLFHYWNAVYDQQWYFHMKDNNNEIVLTSTEGYKTEQECLKGIASVQSHASNYLHYEKFMGSDYKYYFKLKPANHEPIGRSEGYNTVQSREQAIVNCSTVAPKATIKRV